MHVFARALGEAVNAVAYQTFVEIAVAFVECSRCWLIAEGPLRSWKQKHHHCQEECRRSGRRQKDRIWGLRICRGSDTVTGWKLTIIEGFPQVVLWNMMCPCAETEASVRLRVTALKGALRRGPLPAAPKEAPSAAPLSGVARATHTLRQRKLAQGDRSAPCLAFEGHDCSGLLPQQHNTASGAL